ncbi:uncharacterized protein F4812DRAFT_463035 [Daldinia caldariorum]|uniref:uncharacterized protein n=1 Tax=Daldinia caldariorum TaxID=326644 RepID=UPI0020078FFC|nr:uncharacterized protein F4812DRAFT_463035 [Daldinia caldariorum]KAI1463978.1 hypothetical protein F4812DRAFT_463035 [Daldinia caldariorum]
MGDNNDRLVLELTRRLEAERRGREAERRGREAERRGREEAEKRAEEAEKQLRPQALRQYLEACHSISMAIKVQTNKKLTTRGKTTSPTGRVYPRRIIPWDEFPEQQEKIWNLLSDQPFCSNPIFPCIRDTDALKSKIRLIASEIGLRHFERSNVEDAVEMLLNKAYKDEQLRIQLGIRGSVDFESHGNLLKTFDAAPESVEQMTEAENMGTDATTPAPASTPAPSTPVPASTHHKAIEGKKGVADQFCIYRRSDGEHIPALVIEYKAPHKLTIAEVVTGLREEIQPERDVINKDSQGFNLESRRLTAAVITQLFSYMIRKNVQYGYICTGETFVFLHIPKDPSVVYYYVSVPNLDAAEDDENWLHRTAVAQVFAFVLQALRAPPLSQTWQDRTRALDTWVVEFEDILRDIPATERKPPKGSIYKPPRWKKGFTRSPIGTRSRCCPGNSNALPKSKDTSEDEDPFPSPSVSRSLRSKNVAAVTGTTAKGAKQGHRGGSAKGGATEAEVQTGTKTKIEDRPFCSQKCLLGLASKGPMDDRCPNFGHHQRQHISLSKFLDLIRTQLAIDRGVDADAKPLYLSGSVGSLFKICLSSHGYTVVAKGVQSDNLARLQHENKVYDQLRTIQGKYVPVCLGTIDLVRPYYYNGGIFKHFLFLGWAGRPFFDLPDQADKTAIVNAVTAGFKAVHELHVLHGDAEPRNIVYNPYNGEVMIVDFERSKLLNRKPLSLISSNKKRKLNTYQGKQGKNDFAKELQSMTESLERHIR